MDLKTKRTITLSISLVIFIAVIVLAAFFINKWLKTLLSPQERELQKISEEIGKSKFELTGTIIAIGSDNKSLTCKIESGSKTIEQYQGKETKFSIPDYVQILNKESQPIQVSDLKVQDRMNIKGSIEENQLIAELIVLQ